MISRRVGSRIRLCSHDTQASRQVGEMVRRLGDGTGGVGVRPVTAPGELATLAAQLEQTSARLAEAQAQAAALEGSRRELVAWVSHDLSTPLAGIRAMIEALEDRVVEDDETVVRYYATMRREIERLAGLVNDLFELVTDPNVHIPESKVLTASLVPGRRSRGRSAAVDGPFAIAGGDPGPDALRVRDLPGVGQKLAEPPQVEPEE